MPWRHALADARARYLRQQAELGGSEVVLDGAAGSYAPSRLKPLPGEALQGSETAVTTPTTASPQGDAPPSREFTRDDRARRPDWRTNAPPIPEPGLTVVTPAVPLVGDPLAGLDTLEQVAERVRSTYCCGLCPPRKNAVPGEGNPSAKLVLVGEGPGANEDETGRPFVGQAGKLLDGILAAIELRREDVFICNVVKCRPPQNRKPLPEEIEACLPYLRRQLAILQPKVILALGATAAETLLGVKKSLGALRLKVHRYDGIPLVVTYHPAALLRNPNWKKPTWDDVRIARQLLDA